MQQSIDISQLTSKIDVAELQARFESLRKSEYFPAVLGAVAGGLTGAIMAGVISSGKKTEKVVVSGPAETSRQGVVLGMSPKELVQLATVVTGLVRQMQDWRQQNRY